MSIREAFARNWRFLFFFAATALIFWALYTWRMVLLPFMVGLLLAYLLSPVVRWLEKLLPGRSRGGRWAEARRIAAVLVVFIVILGVIGFLLFIGITAVIHSSADLIKNASQIISDFTARLQQWTASVREHLPANLQTEMDMVIQNIGDSIGAALTGLFSSSGSAAGRIMSSIGSIPGFAALPLFLFYLLKDSEKIKSAVYGELPPAASRHTRAVVDIIERVLGRYIRAELLLGLVVGSMTLIGLLIIQAPAILPLAFFNGLCEMIPTAGPIIGGTVMGLVTLALAPDKVWWVLLLAVSVQLLENNLLVPKIQGSNLRLHPALVLLLLVLGGYFWGFWGLLFAVPLTATVVDLFSYVRRINRQEADRTAG